MRLKTKADVIEDYIQQFRQFGTDVVDCFSNGMCYHFMTILRKRFGPFCTTPMYDEAMNHFATKIDDRIYDVTGDITDDPRYHWERWTTVRSRDWRHTERILRDCVDKVPSDTLICKYCDNSFYDEILNTYLCGLDNTPVDLDTPCVKGIERE